MLYFKVRQYLLALICFSLLASISACGTAANTNVTNHSDGPSISTSPSAATATPSASSILIPSVSTNCPTAGTARAAVMPPLQLGKNQNLVFSDHNGNLATFKRYDVQAGTTTAILNLSDEIVQSAQLSGDGQWILFSVEDVNNISKIQLIRVDGQYLQTLYCAPTGQQIDPLGATGMQWSPDQKQIIFPQGGQNPSSIYLLNVTNGTIQVELSLLPSDHLEPRAWIDNKRVYIVENRSDLYILDTSKGANQHASTLAVVSIWGSEVQNSWDFDSSSDGSSTVENGCYVGLCLVVGKGGTAGKGGVKGNGDIFSSNSIFPSSVRFIGRSSSSLLLSVPSSAQNQNAGFWKINVNGTGLVRLNNVAGGFNPFTQFPWSNFSRDGSLYSENNFWGSLNGGPLTQYSNDPATTVVIGWTTM